MSMSLSISTGRVAPAHGMFSKVRRGIAAVRRLAADIPGDEKHAESLGFSAEKLDACPFSDPRLIAAFINGRAIREDWDAAAL
jgi:hypothetical protein